MRIVRYTRVVVTMFVLLMYGANDVLAQEATGLTSDDVIIQVMPSGKNGKGTVTTADGSVSAAIDASNNRKVNLTVTPASGNRTRTALIVAEKMVDPGQLPARRRAPGTGSFTITGPDTDPDGWKEGPTAYVYSFTIDEGYHGAYVTVTFVPVSTTATQITTLDDIDDLTGNYILTRDIDASGFAGFKNADNSPKVFSGTLDGGLHKIYNLSVPLFSSINNGTVKNVILEDVTISSGDSDGDAGAICCKADGATRIYNCGILPSSTDYDNDGNITGFSGSSVSESRYVGSLVGFLDGTSRVINCYSYANISGGTHNGGIVGYNNVVTVSTTADDLKTMVMNCMFYGNISGNSIAPIYNGEIITNDGDADGVNNFNYFWSGASYVEDKKIDVYNCALTAETRFLQRFEFFRHLLNSNRELAAWWVKGSDGKKSDMAKWVMEPSQIGRNVPFPILKTPGYYPSVVNYPPNEISYDEANRNKGRKLTGEGDGGVLHVTISMGSGGALFTAPTGAGLKPGQSATFDLTITDKDYEHFNFNYGKVQLPYYNDYCVGNYTKNRVVTGWKITSMNKSAGSFTTGPDASATVTDGDITLTTPYNFADRKSTAKDVYSETNKRVFSQGAYFDVPEGVTSITIEPYWGKAVYLADAYWDVTYKNGNGTDTKLAGSKEDAMTTASNVPNVGGGQRYENGQKYNLATHIKDPTNGQIVYTSMSNAISSSGSALFSEGGADSHTVYDYAVVLVGNYHHIAAIEASNSKPYTVTSIDLDGDNEPDYSLMLRFNGRTMIHPVRYDFLNLIGLGMAQKTTGGKGSYNLGIMQPKAWFEVTNTALLRVTQFEYDRKDDKNTANTRSAAPYILQGGVFEQWVSGQSSGVSNNTIYFHVGGNVWFKEFQLGTHIDQKNSSNHPPISVTGGDFNEFYLTGLYRGDVTSFNDNAECYINGGRFGVLAGAGQEGLGHATNHTNGNITWQIDNADITEFYGGGFNQPIQGNITTVISNSHVDQFCGGPKFGDMWTEKTVKTKATNCTFGTYFGAGFGGNAYSRRAPSNKNNITGDYTGGKWNTFVNDEYKQEYNSDSKYNGVSTKYDYQYLPMSNNTQNVARLFVDYVRFSLATTRNVTSKLTGCHITGNFYGGGSLGKVEGPVTSTLENCTVDGSVFGAGYSASTPTVNVMNTGGFIKAPFYDENLGAYFEPEFPSSVPYTWAHTDNDVNSTNNAIDKTNHLLYTKEDLTTLGTVTGNATLIIAGTTTVAGSVYGGGEESGVDGSTEVAITGGTIGVQGQGGVEYGNVFGGGKGKRDNVTAGLVKGSTKVTISQTTAEKPTTVYHNVYGGGAYGSVGDFDYDATSGMPTGLKAGAAENSGKTEIYVTGGTIGWSGKENGMVFGSSRGDVGAPGSIEDKLAWVYDTHVAIGDTAANATITTATPIIKGSVYGGGENGHNFRNAYVRINGGTIGIPTGDNVVVTNADNSQTTYEPYNYPYRGNVYGGGCGTDKYYSDPASVTNPYDGKGDEYNPKAGIVQGNAFVNITGGYVVHNVYGAGAMGSVGTALANARTKVNISGGRIGYDGSRNGNVFGAARGEYGKTFAESDLANVSQSEVNISYTTTPAGDDNNKTTQLIAGSVFGGGEAGVVKGSVAVNMTGGLVLKDLYGGGALADTQTSNWDATANSNAGGFATGKTSASATTTVRLTGGTVGEEVFGGGLGEAGKPAYVYGDVLVDLNGTTSSGTTGTPIGSGRGCAVKEVFGGNNVNGSPKGNVMVHVYATQNKNTGDIDTKVPLTFTEPETEKVTYWSGQATSVGLTPATIIGSATADADKIDLLKAAIEANRYDVKAVYGGGNQAAYVPYSPYTADNTTGAKTQVVIEGCSTTSIETVYGGGNAAAVPEANVEIREAREILSVFGGGNGKDDIAPGVANPGADVGLYNSSNYGTGNANTILKGGYVHEAYGGSNQKGKIKGKININTAPEGTCALNVEKLVGAGKNADVDGDLIMVLGCKPTTKTPLVFAGADNADVNGNVELTITSGTFGQVFGGNNLGGVIKGHLVLNIEETGCNPIRIDELYLGGNEAAYSVYGYNEDKSCITSGDPVYEQPVLNVISATSIGKVFGGGLGAGAVMYADPTVNINMIKGKPDGTESANLGTIGNVYGGGNEAVVNGNPTVNIGTATTVTMTSVDDDPNTTDVDEKHPKVLGANITGNVFGGGNQANVTGDTHVNICGTQIADSESENGYKDTPVDHSGTAGFAVSIGNSVYGGGSEADVLGNTFVTMADGYVFNGIFGGGLAGSVGTFDRSTAVTDWGHTANHDGCIGKPTACTAGGTCYVVVSGGQIGPIEVATQGQGMNRLDADGGPVPQGWVWGASCGTVEDPTTHPDTHFKAYVNNTDVTIKDKAFILESIIGGGEFGRVLGNTLVKIQGGQIGVGEGKVDDNNKPISYTDDQFVDPTTTTITTGLATCSHFPFGREVGGKKVYNCYDPYADAYKTANSGSELYPGGVTDYASDGKTWIGCVFAGGSGYMPYVHKDGLGKVTDYDWVRSAGWVEGNTEVRISGGHILTNVYGGNEYTDVKGTSKVKMTGGTVGVPRTKAQIEALPMCGYIYGAGKGDERTHFNTATNVGSAEVEVSGGIVYGSVYGGGEDGHVLGDVTVTIKDGAKIGTVGTSYFDGHVFGGGRGFSGIAQTAGTVGGNVTLNIEGGTMLGSVYGGGRLASVGTQFTAPDDDNYGNFVEDETAANGKKYGHVTVTITGGTIGNAAATGDGAQYSGNVFGGSMGRLDLLNGTRNPIWPKMAQVKSTTVNVSGSNTVIMRNVFGGGELGTVREDAVVTVSDGTVRRDVYGGGYGSDDMTHTILTVKELESDNQYHNHIYAFTPMQFAGCVGKSTTVNVSGGYIRKSVYGGGEMASVGVINYRAAELTSGTSTDGKVYFHDAVSNKDYYYENIVKHADATKEFALSWPYKFEYVTGYPGATHVNITGGRLGLKTGDTDSGFEDNGDVYGAGKGMAGDFNDYLFCANVGSTDVKIAYETTPTAYSGDVDCVAGAVYGGGEDGHVIGDTKLTISGGLINHSVYGAGSGKGKFSRKLLKSGKTYGSTSDSDYETRDAYSITAGKVFGNSTVEMSGGYVVRNIYGGGNMGSVGKGNYAGGAGDYSANGYGEKVANLWSNTDFKNSGKCTVKISGGTIGYIDADPSNSMYPYNSSASLPYGNVFGGCRGEAVPNITDSPRYYYCPEFFVGYANETSVTIEGDNTKILGSVYGGGMDGHVRRDASVIIKGGEIGLPFTAANKTLVGTTDPDNIQWLARGNVYGAGSGIGKYNDEFCTSAGSVTRFTTVSIQGGTIHRNLYGGGSLASIGAPKIPANSTTNPTKAQTLNKVTISGGQIGGNYSYNDGVHVYGGHVFGGSRGDASLRNSTLSFSTSMFTEVNVETGANIAGSVFGGGEVGIVKGDVAVNINGGTIGDDVYGGGALADTNTENAKDANGDLTAAPVYNTAVNLIGGSIGGDAYGGGLGQLGTDPIAAMVYGDVHVTLGNETEVETNASATKFTIDYLTDNSDPSKPVQVVKSGRVFGCNNLNGSPKGNVTVTVNRTAKVKDTNGDVISRTAITRDATTSEITSIATPHVYEVAAVYGGGNLANYTAAGKKARVEVMSCDVSIEEVYGGGNAAKVPATDVEVKGAHQIERVFGGGNGKDKYTLDGGTSWVVNPGADIDGDANTIIKGGLIHEAYGGSNEKGTITGNITINTETDGCAGCPTQIDKLVGAGKNADVNGNLIMVLGCYPKTRTPLIFAGADNANVNGNVELTITSGTFGKVFGGNNQGGAIKGHIVLNIEETGCNPIKIEELYLGGNEAAYSVYGYNADGSCITSGAAKAYADPVLNVVSCTSIGKVFGGGYGIGGVMYADPTVNINMIPGAFKDNITATADNLDQLGAIGDVYGGGNAADVIGNPKVNIGTASKVKLHLSYTPTDGYTMSDDQTVKGAYITGNVFGAGMGKGDSFTCEKAMVGIDGDGVTNPTGGTTVNIYNGVVLGCVYGGGEVGRVEKNTLVTIGTGDGVDATQDTPISAPVIKGSVFGGGKGLATHGYSALVRGNPTVVVQGNAKVRGNVYGGGQIASVARYKVAATDDEGAPYGVKKDEPYALKTNNSGICTVTVRGYAEIGPETIGEEKTTSVGHVFGAGKGILPGGDYAFVSGTTKRMVSLKNEQNQITGSDWETFDTEADYITFIKTLALASQTNVTIDGNAKVKGSVYGGSESGFVQFDTEVNIAGGTVGTQGKGGADFGNVYGGGKGDVEYTGVNNDYIAAGIVKGNTKIVVSQAAGKTTQVLHNIYGGGAYGTVGEFEYDANGVPTARKTYTVGTDVHTTTGGKTEVYITGGTIGTNGNENGMVFGSSRGDVGATGSIHDKAAWVYNTHVAIGDTVATTTTTATPLIKGSVYGGGENGHNLHNAYVRINGGTIGIPEGEPIGTYTAGGASYPYRGNVYGGGCGTDKYDNKTKYNPQAGIVRGNVVLNMTAGHVVHNMYGAGAMGSVGKKVVTAGVTTITGGQTTISISGGQLGVDDESDDDGNVFGAARGASDATGDDLAMVYGNANVTLSGGAVYGSVFGGGQRGVTLGSVAVNMTGGSVSKDIYGGGALADTNTGALSNTTTTYKTIVNLLGGTIGGDAYGGGLGQLGAEPVEAKVYGDTKVNLNGLEAGDYAEGLHKPLTEGTTARLVSIVDDNNQVKEYQINDAVQGAVVGRIFGCNNLNGSPQGTVKVHVFKTQRAGQTRITNTSEVTTAKVKVEPTNGDYNLKSFDVEAVYGGGNMAAYVPADLTTGKTLVIIDGCDRTSIGQVYGGGNAASVPATDVTINGTYEIYELFAGGNGYGEGNPGANVGFYDYHLVENENWCNTKTKRSDPNNTDFAKYIYGSGKASVNVFGGTIHRVFGGSNTKGNVRLSAITLLEDQSVCDFCVDEAYGGGKSAPMDAEAKLLMACIPGLKEVYGGAEAADVYDDVSVTITNGTFDRVFGGNNLSGTIRGKITVNVEETGCKPVIIGELYGGGNQAGYSVYGYNADKTVIESGTDKLYEDPQINVKSFTSIGTVYGGGYGAGAVMVGNPTVNINVIEDPTSDAQTKSYTYTDPVTSDQSTKYYSDYAGGTITVDAGKSTEHTVTLPPHTKGQMGVINNVFGGGNAARVVGDTHVNIGTETGNQINMVSLPNVDNSGNPVLDTNGKPTYEQKTVKGANIVGNVYGGGNNAEVTGETHVQIGK